MLHQGFRANPPVEYFEDPLSMQGPCPDHDLRDATVRARLLELAKAPPDADVPNLWEWGTPCTTFCDFQRLNGGTRTALRTEGDGTRADEVQGNDFAEFASELCLELHRAGRVFGFESSAPSGGYPKIWDLPCMKRLREQTGARIVPMHMCAWFLQPSSCRPMFPWGVPATCLGSQPPGWLSSIRYLCAPLGAWPFGLRSSNGIGASTLLANAPCKPLRSTRLDLARRAAHRSISVTPCGSLPPHPSGGEKAGGVGETPPGESSALEENQTENQTSPEGPSASQHNSEGLVPAKVKLPEAQQPPLDTVGSSCSVYQAQELYTTEALEARERYTGLTLIQRRRVEDALGRGELLDPPAFKQRYGLPGFLVADNRRIAESSQSTKDQVMVSPGEDVGQHHKVGAPNVSATAQSYLECCSAAFSKETLAEASGLGSALLKFRVSGACVAGSQASQTW